MSVLTYNNDRDNATDYIITAQFYKIVIQYEYLKKRV